MQRNGVFLLCLAMILVLVPWGGGGCRSVRSPSGTERMPDDPPGFGARLFLAAGLVRWQAEEAPDVGIGLEGLYRLVNGAAESYWDRGVTRAAFQEFTMDGSDGVLELHSFTFRSAAHAGRFFEQVCREEGGQATGTHSSSRCLFPGEPLRRALLRRDRTVLDLQLYGTPASNPITRLVQAFDTVPQPSDREE